MKGNRNLIGYDYGPNEKINSDWLNRHISVEGIPHSSLSPSLAHGGSDAKGFQRTKFDASTHHRKSILKNAGTSRFLLLIGIL